MDNSSPTTNVKRSYNSNRKTIPNVQIKVKRNNKRLDNTPFNTLTTTQYIQMTVKLAYYRKQKGLSPEALETLFSVYSYYVLGLNGVTVFMLCKAYTGAKKINAELNNVNKRVVRLLSKGLVCVVGKSENGALLYSPSSVSISDIEALCK